MLNNHTNWNIYLEHMLQQAYEEFRRTDYYHALKERHDFMEKSCESNFREGDFARIMDWIDTIYSVNSAENEFMYRRGYKDCVDVLKRLEVI